MKTEQDVENRQETNPIELLTSVGLMLDIDQKVQLYHSWRVAVIAYRLAERLASYDAPFVFMAGMLLDCGAIRFKRHIVHELIDHPSVLGQKSQIHLFFHPIAGYEAARCLPGLSRVARLILHHHECYNGNGYPDGLKGEAIDLGAQILRLADQLDLIIRSDQPEHEADVIQSLKPFEGEDFSPPLLGALGDLMEKSLSFGRLLHWEKIVFEVERICDALRGIQFFSTETDWEGAVSGIGELIDCRNDRYSRGHSARMAELADKIADLLNITGADRRVVKWTAYLQNMGEVSLRRAILAKEGRLDETERQLVRHHPIISHDLLSRVRGFSDVARSVRSHHENWDGSGYPEGLVTKEIPIASRIIRVIDAFDAMTMERPYHRRKDWKQAIKEIKRYSGRHFDPEVAEVTVEVLEN